MSADGPPIILGEGRLLAPTLRDFMDCEDEFHCETAWFIFGEPRWLAALTPTDDEERR
jgi:hypothetical protein